MQTETIHGYLWKEPCRVTQCVEETRTGVDRGVETRRDPLRKKYWRERGKQGEKEKQNPS